MPADFAVSERVKAWAAGKGFGQLDEHLESFRGKCRANGYAYTPDGWDDAFMTAIREDWAKLRQDVRGKPTAAPISRKLREL